MERESLQDIYILENRQLAERLEELILDAERQLSFSAKAIDEIFRILHTIKGASAMMGFDSLSEMTHALEDIFSHLRAHGANKDLSRQICSIGLRAADFINACINNIEQTGVCPDADAALLSEINARRDSLLSTADKPDKKPVSEEIAALEHSEHIDSKASRYRIEIRFEPNCQMENVRAFGIVKSLEGICGSIKTTPHDLSDNVSSDQIKKSGLILSVESDETLESIKAELDKAFFVESVKISHEEESLPSLETAKESGAAQSYVNVNLSKLDKLMDLVGEIIIAESSLTRAPNAALSQSEGFDKAARQLRKLHSELRDIAMSVRMVPVAATFNKMRRLVRDISLKTGKKAELHILGESTELDKNILDRLSEPLIHIIRNSIDHGIEQEDERLSKGKSRSGVIRLSARSEGGDILISVSDDGRGLNRDALLKKGIERGLVSASPDELSDNEIYSLIFAAGFSTKEEVTEFSGRGVGMDAALKSIEKVGGSL
ncbi:MAG: Hpt domain-containing protein, partial [Christensenellales bacterium]